MGLQSSYDLQVTEDASRDEIRCEVVRAVVA
jgi:hypothetical protein